MDLLVKYSGMSILVGQNCLVALFVRFNTVSFQHIAKDSIFKANHERRDYVSSKIHRTFRLQKIDASRTWLGGVQ